MQWRVLGLAAGFFALAGFARLPRHALASASPPNILFVLADDLDAAELDFMPHVQSLLVDQGVSFSNYFVSVSLCCPSRTTMLRGQYSHNTGVRTNGGGNGGFEFAFAMGLEKSTVATWLQASGYRTALYGKYLNGYPNTAPNNYVPPGWTGWGSAVMGDAYSEFDYTLNENGHPLRYGSRASDYGTDVYSRLAAAFMRRATAARKPFFVYLSLYAPHVPATPAPRHASLFPDARAPRTPSFDELDVSDKPTFIRYRPRLRPRALLRLDSLYRSRLRSLQAVDEAVAGIVDTLRAIGQLDNTYIVFASDNGFHMGQHRLVSGKESAYEEDIRVPLIVRGPGVPAGRTVEDLAGNVDLAPTFASLGGAAVPAFVDGRSLAPLFLGTPRSSWRQAYLVEHWPEEASADSTREPTDADQATGGAALGAGRGGLADGGARGGVSRARPGAIPEFHALRTATHTYVEYVTGERELYDLAADPFELNNLAATADSALLQSLASRLKLMVSCKAASCREAEARRH